MVNYCELTNDELTKLIAVKDRGLMSFIYDKYAPAIYGLILRRVQVGKQADDILCKTFIDFFTALNSQFSFNDAFICLRNIATLYIKKGNVLYLIPRNYSKQYQNHGS
jgi:hypothetical protein